MFRFFFFLFFICFSFASFGDTVIVKRSKPAANTRMLRSGGSGSGVTYTSVNREFVASICVYNINAALPNYGFQHVIENAKAGDIYFCEFYFFIAATASCVRVSMVFPSSDSQVSVLKEFAVPQPL